MQIVNVVFSEIKRILEDAEQRQFGRLQVLQWVLENGLPWATKGEDDENLDNQTTPAGIEIPQGIVELPPGVNWRDCNIVIVDGVDAPGRIGTGRRKKNDLARNFAGQPAREWVENWRTINRNYPVSTNNARMCTKAGYMLLQTPDGLIVNRVP